MGLDHRFVHLIILSAGQIVKILKSCDFHNIQIGNGPKDGYGRRMFMKKLLILSLILTFLLFQPAYAATFAEGVNDAGELISTAAITTGNGDLDKIFGTLFDYSDVDLFAIHIDLVDQFSVTVSSTLSGNNDTMLWLFDSDGKLAIQNDEGSDGIRPQFDKGKLTDPYVPGDYFLGISLFETMPEGDPLSGWDQDPWPKQSGDYTLNITGASFLASPEPASMMLFGIGLLSFAGFMRRKE